MNDPVRLLEVGASEFEADLLRAGRSDGMSTRSRRQILAGIGIGGLLTASTVATGVRAATKGWFVAAGVGAASVLAVWVGVRVTTPSPTSPPALIPVATALPARAAAPPIVATPAETARVDNPPATAVAPVPKAVSRSTPAERSDASLTAELSALEQARGAFLSRDYAHALRLLDDYARRFPKRRLQSEATVLRIETLSARGDRDTAARVGREFLQIHPNGPYAKRVRSVIGDTGASGASTHTP